MEWLLGSGRSYISKLLLLLVCVVEVIPIPVADSLIRYYDTAGALVGCQHLSCSPALCTILLIGVALRI